MSATLACISWKLPIALAELLALADIGQDDVEARLHDPELDSGEHGALIIEPAHQHPDPAILRPHDVLGRNEAIVEHQLGGRRSAHPHLVHLLADREALHALFDQEGGDPARPLAGLGIDHQRVGIWRRW